MDSFLICASSRDTERFVCLADAGLYVMFVWLSTQPVLLQLVVVVSKQGVQTQASRLLHSFE